MRTTRAALFLGAAFLALPAQAQDTPQQVTPPPIMTTPAPAPAPAPAPQPQVVIQPSAPVVQSVPSVEEQQRGAAAADAPAPAERRATATRTTTTRTTTTRAGPAPARQAAPAPAAETPTAPPSPPIDPSAVPAPLPPQAETAPAPEAAAPVATDTTTTQTSSTAIAWPWLIGGLALLGLGIIAFLFTRRRRNEEAVTTETAYAEPAYVAPVAAAPVVVEPVAAPDAAVIAQVPPADERIVRRELSPAIVPEVAAAEQVEEAEIADASKDDLAGVADAAAPVSHRPWIELGLRPVSAGTTEEEAMVDFELTVGNSGDTQARNVRISSFMLADEAESTEMERMLTERRADTIVPPVSIEPGDGTRVDAHLAVPKGDLGRVFNPVVVAEARYTLPDGSEARTAAAFRIGRPAYEGGIGAIGASRPHVTDDLAAELYGQPEHV